jgi:hypothetical protein
VCARALLSQVCVCVGGVYCEGCWCLPCLQGECLPQLFCIQPAAPACVAPPPPSALASTNSTRPPHHLIRSAGDGQCVLVDVPW